MFNRYSRRQRRLAILLTVIAVVAGGVVALVYARQWQRQQQDLHDRATGVAAYEAGEYSGAARALGRYLQRAPEDVDALYLYAQANLHHTNPSPRNLSQAMNALIQINRLAPENVEASEQLLEIYKLSAQDEKALDLADEILERDPDNADALGTRAVSLARMGRQTEALTATRTALEQDPDSVALHLLMLQLRYQLGDVPDDLVRYAADLRAQHPDDPRYEMALGYAYAMAGDESESLRWLRSAAEHPVDDPMFALTLVSVLDTANLYDQALAVLVHAATPDNKAGLLAEMARRLFEAQRYGELNQRLAALYPDITQIQPAELALRAMALHQMDRTDEAAPLVAELEGRRNQPTAAVWASVIKQVYAEPRRPVPQTIGVLNEALQTMPNNAYVHAFLGDAHAVTGDSERALDAWRRAAELRPTWAGIRTLLARTLLASGHSDEALELARAALVRQPSSVDAAVVFVRARAAILGESDRAGAEQLLAMIDEVQQVAPGEPHTMLLRVAMLARTEQRDAARALVRELIDREPPLPESMLLQLSDISRREELGLQEAILARAEERAGQTPEVALARAHELARAGQFDEGLARLQAGRDAASGDRAVEWEAAIAGYLDAHDHPDAHDAWVRLADEHPDHARLQRAALGARATRNDREFTGRVLERLRGVMGEDTVAYRLERAKWLLESPDVERDAAAAATQLREVIADAPRRLEPRLLLARALERLGRIQIATRELRAADQAIPGTPVILLELARLSQELKQYANSAEALDAVLASDRATNDQRRTAAALLARQGEEAQAIGVLRSLRDAQGELGEDEQLLLASLYARTGQLDEAVRQVESMVAEAPSASSLAFALQIFQMAGDPARVDAVLQRLDSADLPEDEKRQVLAGFYAQSGQDDRAMAVLREATEADPSDTDAWRRLVSFELSSGEVSSALETADAAAQAVADPAPFETLRQHADAARAAARDDSLRGLTTMLVSRDPTERELAGRALQAALDVSAGDQGPAERARRLQVLAEAHPGVLALQIATGRALLRADQPQAAAELASRAARAFPTASEPAWLLTEAMRVQERWLDVLGAASEWRERAVTAPMAADLMIVEAKLRLGEAGDTLPRLQPYLESALADPLNHIDIMSRYLRALVANGRTSEAGDLILPLVPQSQAYRLLATNIAGEQIGDAATAARWLEVVGEHTPAGADADRMLLGQAWWTLSQRSDDPSHRQRAQALVEGVTSGEAATAAAWYMRGAMAEQGGQLDAAEQAYRQALQLEPRLTLAQNNLAMVVISRGGDASEALSLAEAAVAAEPGNTSYLDTLALVQSAAGQHDAAIATINRAIRQEPTRPEWQRSLLKILETAGRTDEAEQLRRKLHTQFGARS